MNISGLRPYEGFYNRNTIKAESAAGSQPEEVQKIDNSPAKQEQDKIQAQPPVEQNYTSYDYSRTYRPGEVYSLKGVDSDIYSLDTQKAISDLDKDLVLRQYQFFVGDKINETAPEKTFRTGENFIL